MLFSDVRDDWQLFACAGLIEPIGLLKGKIIGSVEPA
jgi:hypothetical protein